MERQPSTYAVDLQRITRMLQARHGDNYRCSNTSTYSYEFIDNCSIFNISRKRDDLINMNRPGNTVVEFGWPEELSPPLERLCAICKELDNWYLLVVCV